MPTAPSHHHHEASSSHTMSQLVAAASEPCPAAAAPAADLSCLPAAVLLHHVLPHLSQWARKQLRAACKALRAAVDASGIEHLTVKLRSAELQVLKSLGAEGGAKGGRQGSVDPGLHEEDAAAAVLWPEGTGDRARAKERVLCNMLDRLQSARSLKLLLSGPQLSLPRPFAVQLHSSSHLQLRFLEELTTNHHLHPELLQHIAHACPALQHLALEVTVPHNDNDWVLRGDVVASGTPKQWAAAARTLPHTLCALDISIEADMSRLLWRCLVLSFAAATQLTQLQHLSIAQCGEQPLGEENGVAPLAAIAKHLTHLSLTSRKIVGVQPLLAACSSTLTSLKLPKHNEEQLSLDDQLPQRLLKQLPQLVPHLRSLENADWEEEAYNDEETAAFQRAALHALSQLRGLRRLVPPSCCSSASCPGHSAHCHLCVSRGYRDSSHHPRPVLAWQQVLDCRLLGSSLVVSMDTKKPLEMQLTAADAHSLGDSLANGSLAIAFEGGYPGGIAPVLCWPRVAADLVPVVRQLVANQQGSLLLGPGLSDQLHEELLQRCCQLCHRSPLLSCRSCQTYLSVSFSSMTLPVAC